MINKSRLTTIFFMIALLGFFYGLLLVLRGGILGIGIIIVALGFGWVGKSLSQK
jgi:hypothetical protein